jgi:hypothetical protein
MRNVVLNDIYCTKRKTIKRVPNATNSGLTVSLISRNNKYRVRVNNDRTIDKKSLGSSHSLAYKIVKRMMITGLNFRDLYKGVSSAKVFEMKKLKYYIISSQLLKRNGSEIVNAMLQNFSVSIEKRTNAPSLIVDRLFCFLDSDNITRFKFFLDPILGNDPSFKINENMVTPTSIGSNTFLLQVKIESDKLFEKNIFLISIGNSVLRYYIYTIAVQLANIIELIMSCYIKISKTKNLEMFDNVVLDYGHLNVVNYEEYLTSILSYDDNITQDYSLMIYLVFNDPMMIVDWINMTTFEITPSNFRHLLFSKMMYDLFLAINDQFRCKNPVIKSWVS